MSSNFFDSGESFESTTQEARAKNQSSKKISAMRENLKKFSQKHMPFVLTFHCGEISLFTSLIGWVRLFLLEEMERTSGRTAFFRLVRWRLESGLLWCLLFTPISVPNCRLLLSWFGLGFPCIGYFQPTVSIRGMYTTVPVSPGWVLLRTMTRF